MHDTFTSIREARSEDVDFLARIDLLVDEETGETYHHGWGTEQHAAHRERIAEFVHDPSRLAIVAECGADLRIGMLLARMRDLVREPSTPDARVFLETLWPALPSDWRPTDGRFAEVFQLWVDPEHRRRGVASKLKQQLHDAAARRGLGLVYTHTRASNTAVQALNARLGYRAFRRGTLWDEVVRVSLAKRLE